MEGVLRKAETDNSTHSRASTGKTDPKGLLRFRSCGKFSDPNIISWFAFAKVWLFIQEYPEYDSSASGYDTRNVEGDQTVRVHSYTWSISRLGHQR
jgi:hypothetical protein